MTALRPERESGSAYGDQGEQGTPYGQQPYGVPGAFEAAVERLADPLTDPLPAPGTPAGTAPWSGPSRPPAPGPDPSPTAHHDGPEGPGSHRAVGATHHAHGPGAPTGQDGPGGSGSPGGRHRAGDGGHGTPGHGPGQTPEPVPQRQETAPYRPDTAPPPAAARSSAAARPLPAYEDPYAAPSSPYDASPPPAAGPVLPPAGPMPPLAGPMPPLAGPVPPADDETVALRTADVSRAVDGVSSGTAAAPRSSDGSGGTDAPGGTPVPGGRAARRRAARKRGRRGGPAGSAERSAAGEGPGTPSAPLSRVEARRAARARRPGAAVVLSRAIGEVFITTGVLMLLFVTYQLWWTNVRAHAQAGNEAHSLQDDWANGKGKPDAFEPGQGFALLHIPELDVVVPIAEGVSNKGVLDRGMVGHYGGEGLKTAMPDAKTGNFGLAGHRNTHGEPFRYINRLKPGDPIVVETQDTYYVYKMASILPVTSPSNISVLDPIPKGSGFTEAGRYITLTTCTPEFTSKYRMIVWGRMTEERPRSEGKPAALVE